MGGRGRFRVSDDTFGAMGDDGQTDGRLRRNVEALDAKGRGVRARARARLVPLFSHRHTDRPPRGTVYPVTADYRVVSAFPGTCRVRVLIAYLS